VNLPVSGFDWDGGNRTKCQKHGVSIAEIEALFMHNPRIAPAPMRSADDDRLIAVGRTSAGRPVIVAFTIRTKDKRRLIPPVPAALLERMIRRLIEAIDRKIKEIRPNTHFVRAPF
jgi:uncharacterized DUF497 family protein